MRTQGTQEVHRLVERIIALFRFISRSVDQGLPFFKVLHKSIRFAWDQKCEQAFADLKRYLEGLPVLYKLVAGSAYDYIWP